MQESPFNFVELNDNFSIESYLKLDDEERREFRNDLRNCIEELQKEFKVKIMTKEDLLSVGMKNGNRTALAITILTEKLTPYNYDQTFHFRDTITILRRQLLEELFAGKNIFYDLGDKAVGLDPNYAPFILGKKFLTIP